MQGAGNEYAISYNEEVARLIFGLNCVIAISTYQAGKIILIGSVNGSSLYQIPVSFKKPMGIALLDHRMAVATLNEIQIFSSSSALAELYPDNPGFYDRLYVPRATYYCGETDLHDLSFGNGGLWAVNTKFSCLSTYDINYSFTPRWQPPFITDLKPEDRCHLNGMAMMDKVPAFVTALSRTDTPEGWRKDIIRTGVLMKVPEGEIVLENLPMPHSPRIIDGVLYLLFSATGELVRVDIANKSYETVLKVPAFLRGMASHGNYLFIAQSKVRRTSKTFSKLPVSEMADHAGILIFDRAKDRLAGEIVYDTTVEEIYDVQVLPGMRRPGLMPADDERHRNAVTLKNMSFWKKENP